MATDPARLEMLSALARKVREVLDEPGVPQPATAQ